MLLLAHLIFPKYLLESKMHRSFTNIVFKLSCLIILSFFINCASDDDGGPADENPTDPGSGEVAAAYNLELTTSFTEIENPQDYPTNASFGTIVAIVHAPEISVYRLGQIASDGMALYAESGDVEGLAAFIGASLGQNTDGLFSITTGGTVGAESSVTTSVSVTPVRSRITYLARLNPSPDWFLGVSDFDVVDGNTLIDMAELSLQPIDAGVVLGDTYEANGGSENAAINIYNGAPFGNGNSTAQPIATLSIERMN